MLTSGPAAPTFAPTFALPFTLPFTLHSAALFIGSRRPILLRYGRASAGQCDDESEADSF
jgi:hypothetical protein